MNKLQLLEDTYPGTIARELHYIWDAKSVTGFVFRVAQVVYRCVTTIRALEKEQDV